MPKKNKAVIKDIPPQSDRERIMDYEIKKSIKEGKKISHIFVKALALISVLGFVSIISENLFQIDLNNLIEPVWLIIMGAAFIIEASPIKLYKQLRQTLDEKNFNRITTLVIGIVAFVSGFLTIPLFSLDHFIFSAMKGLVSFVAIIFIIIETWVIRQ